MLLAVFLRIITGWIANKTPLSCFLSYVAALLLVLGFSALAAWLAIPGILSHMSQITSKLPSSIHRLEMPLLRTAWGANLISRADKMFGTAIHQIDIRSLSVRFSEGVVRIVVIVVIGFFASLNPRGYEDGLLSLLPESRRQRAAEIAGEVARQLKWWLLGQLFIMAVLGVSCGLALWLLHVPLAGTLGLLTGIAVFLPYVGTVAAGVPSVLMGLQRSPATAIYVLILYTGLHLLEGYFLTPFVQRKAVRLPPVLTVLSQYFLWNVAGVLGVAVAAPLATTAIVLTKILYIHVPADQPIVVKHRDFSC